MSKSNDDAVADLQWKKFPVLNDGFVTLVDVMGDDAAIVQAARVSYNKDARNGDTTAGTPDRTLLRYLMRMGHATPFEMCEIKLLVRIPMDAHRQFVRHRTAAINEYSTRYTEAIDARQETAPDGWRLQATNNKQGSSGFLAGWPDGWKCVARDHQVPCESYITAAPLWDVIDPSGATVLSLPRPAAPARMGDPPEPGQVLTALEAEHHADASEVYQLRLALGVAREQARKDLPLSTYTELYWKCDLRNVLHFLGLRMDSHAQKEIRDYATIIGEQIVAKLFPLTWEAFCDYRLGSMSLSRLDQEVMIRLLNRDTPGGRKLIDYPFSSWIWPEEWRTASCRERVECADKLVRIGAITR